MMILSRPVKSYLNENPLKINLFLKFFICAILILAFIFQNWVKLNINISSFAIVAPVCEVLLSWTQSFWKFVIAMFFVTIILEYVGEILHYFYIKKIDAKDLDKKSKKFIAKWSVFMDCIEILYRILYLVIALFILFSVINGENFDTLIFYFILSIFAVCTFYIGKSYSYHMGQLYSRDSATKNRINEKIEEHKQE